MATWLYDPNGKKELIKDASRVAVLLLQDWTASDPFAEEEPKEQETKKEEPKTTSRKK